MAMGLKTFLLKVFTWRNCQTFGTQLYTWRKGRKVGEDGQGNVFYQTADGKRRWVIYNGEAEASRVSPEWHGWLHYTYQEPPTSAPLPRKAWEKPHVPNLTGSALAYRPPGSMLSPGPQAQPDYEAWVPE
jgi:NADH:ubiquinone oxidoreductase subunit